jgi:malonate transporter and related proteins
MSSVALSLVPVLLLIATGWATRVTGLIGESHWAGFERVTYYILFPALIIETLAQADLGSVPIAALGGALAGGILLMAALLLALRPGLKSYWRIEGPAFTSVFQGATRWNTFVALALAASLYGREGTALCAVAVAVMIPLLNVLALAVLSRYASATSLSGTAFLHALVVNPFIWSCFVGVGLNALGWPLPAPVDAFGQALGRSALAAGLLLVGAGLDVKRLARPTPALALATLLKLIVMPIGVAMLAQVVGLSGTALAVAVISAAVPSASASYILARQMGGDAALMAQILTTQNVAALLTLPLALELLT